MKIRASVLFIAALVTASHAFAAGADDRKAVREFRAIGQRLAHAMGSLDGTEVLDSSENRISSEEFAQMVKSATVVPVHEELTRELSGTSKHVDAKNYPDQKKIELFVPGWKLLSAENRRALVLHEYLGLMRVEKDVYDSSSSVLRQLRETQDKSKPENQCSSASLGFHDGSACLWHVSEPIDSRIAKLEKTIGRRLRSNPAKAAEFERWKAGFKKAADVQCDVENTDNLGNAAAYYGELCAVKSSLVYEKALRKYLRQRL